MSASAATSVPAVPARQWRSVLLVCFCTLLGASAQILMKIGMMHFKAEPLALLTNFPLIGGYALYGLFTLLLVIALREGELSMLYPIISLGYVWVIALSYFLFHDSLNTPKTIGIVSIMLGVGILGQGEEMTGTPLTSILLVFGASVIGSFGAVFLKLGAARTNAGILSFLNPQLALGVILYLGSSVFYGAGIRHGQLSVLYPMVSLGYVWTLLWARLFFQEQFTRQKFLGLTLVLIGVCFVGIGS